MSQPGGTAPFRRILPLVVALIVYGSLYPWQFQARHLAAGPLWFLLHSWPATLNRYAAWDVAVNMTLYVPLGIFAYLAVKAEAPLWRRALLPLALAVALSASMEMLQLFDDGRLCSTSDLVSNVAGAAVGAAAGALYRNKLQRFLSRAEAAVLRPSGAILLLSCWLGYQVFPLFPAWGRTSVLRKLAALGHQPAIQPAATFIVFAEWLAAACLLESLLGERTKELLVLIGLALPARLLIAGRTLTSPDIAGAVAAGLVWLCVPRSYVRRAAPAVLAGAVILAEMAPFHFDGAGAFNWVPFRGFLRAPWQNAFVVLFRKSYSYGAVLWLWRAAGHRLAAVAAAAAAGLFILERVQIYLPGRTPEVTDAVLALLMGVLLGLLRDS